MDSAVLLQSLAGLVQATQLQQQQHQQQQSIELAQQQQAGANQAVLAQLITGLAGALAGVQQATSVQQHHQPLAIKQTQPLHRPGGFHQAVPEVRAFDRPSLEITGPLPSVDEFVAQNALEPWVTEALHMLTEEQRAHVMRTQLNLENTTNLNGVITSRIKEVAPVEQRLQMFIQLNGLADGVVDRLSTLTSDQHEKVMESTLKIQKANNPSGVAMRRITDVLRNERLGIAHGPHMSSPGYRDNPVSIQSAPVAAPVNPGGALAELGSAASILATLVQSLGGGGAVGNAAVRDRSRSTPPPALAASQAHIPREIQVFVQEYALEWWVGEVLSRLSLWQRQQVMTELGNMQGVRNPSGVVMARVRQVVSVQEMLTIFIDINQIDQQVAAELWGLSEEQQQAVIAPGIYIQNARNTSVAARSRIRQVLAGNDAMGGAARAGPRSPGFLSQLLPEGI